MIRVSDESTISAFEDFDLYDLPIAFSVTIYCPPFIIGNDLREFSAVMMKNIFHKNI